MKKQGARKHDVKPETLKKRLLDFHQDDECSADQLTHYFPTERLFTIFNVIYNDDQKQRLH